MAEQERLHATVHGHVQGVGFRHWAMTRARALGLAGFVRNCADRAVEVVAEGERTELDELLAQLRLGFWPAAVTRVDVSWEPATGQYHAFDVDF